MLNHGTSTIPEIIETSKAILLDYNGTLSDDEQVLFEIIASMALEDFGIRLDATRYFTEFVGQTEEHIFSVLALESSSTEANTDYLKKLLHKFNDSYLERVKRQKTISSETRKFVHEAKSRGKLLALVTAASQDIVKSPLVDAGIYDSFDVIVCLEDVSHSKPAPDAYLRALEILGVDSSDGVAFEDSKTGITAATGAGIKCVAVLGSLNENEASELTTLLTNRLSDELFNLKESARH